MTRPWSPLRTPTFWLLLVTLAVGTLGTFLLMVFIALFTPLAALVSLPPLLVFGLLCLLLIRQLDHLGRRPWWLVFMAYAWGATASVLAASGFNWFADVILAKVFGPWFAADWGAAIVAPIGEEIIKGVGVALLILAARPYLRTVFSGAVYGAIVGVGFAVVEDATYAWGSADETLPDNVGEAMRILVLRIMVPGVAGHPLFSALVGAGVAYFALRTDQSRGRRFGMLGLGFGLGALAHFAVNAPLGFIATNALDGLPGFAPLGGLLLVIAAPALLGWIWLARLRRTEAEQLTAELADPTRFPDPTRFADPTRPVAPVAEPAAESTAESGAAAPAGAGEPATAVVATAVATADEAFTLASSLRRFRVVRAVRRAHGAAAARAVRRLHRAQLRFVQLPVEPVPATPAVYTSVIPGQPFPAPIVPVQPVAPPAVPAPAASPVQASPVPASPAQGAPAAPVQMAAPAPWPYPPMTAPPLPGQLPPPLPGQWTPYGPAPVMPGQWQPVPGGQWQPVPGGQWQQPVPGGQWQQPVPGGQWQQPVPGGQWPPMPGQYPPPAQGAWYPMPVPPAWYPMPAQPAWQPPPPRPTPVQLARVELAAARAELARLTGSENPSASPSTPAPAPAWLLASGYGLAVLGVVHWAAVLLGLLVVGVPMALAWRRKQPLPPRLSWAVAAVVFSGYLWVTSWLMMLLFPGEV